MLLVLVELVLAALLLAASIFETGARSLLKSSVPALFLHGFDGWDTADAGASNLYTSCVLDRCSRAMVAAL